MTDLDPPFPDDDDLLAAEYVLGTLDPDAWRAARGRAETDGAFAARVRDWEGRLAPLNAAYPEAPVPPAALAGIEARLFPAPYRGAGRRSPLGIWLAGLGAAVLTAVAVIALLFTTTFAPDSPTVPGRFLLTGDLVSDEGRWGFVATYFEGAEIIQIGTYLGEDYDPGSQDLQLWALGDDGTPRSLGLIRDQQVALAEILVPGLVLAISLEPLGGSPQPVPTGPVLAVGALTTG